MQYLRQHPKTRRAIIGFLIVQGIGWIVAVITQLNPAIGLTIGIASLVVGIWLWWQLEEKENKQEEIVIANDKGYKQKILELYKSLCELRNDLLSDNITDTKVNQCLQLAIETKDTNIIDKTTILTQMMKEGQQNYRNRMAHNKYRAKWVRGKYLSLADKLIKEILTKAGKR